jgi:MFS family permease
MIGNMMVTTSLASVVAGYIYGRFRAHYSGVATFVVGFSVMACGMSLIGIVAHTYQMIAAMAVAGLGQGLAIPNYWSLAGSTGSERYRARTMGLAKSGMYGGPLIAQLVLEPVVARTHYAVAFGALAAASATFALFFGWQVVGRGAKIATLQ